MTPPRLTMPALVVTALLAASFVQAQDFSTPVASRDGRYLLSYASELQPLVINRIHRWTLRLQLADGSSVEGASFSISGGMPRHDHGLPTQPVVTTELGEGVYVLEGMRFHMAGTWEIVVRIEAPSGNDTAIITAEL